jgi:hypothetical protein
MMGLYAVNSRAASYGNTVVFSNDGPPVAITGPADATSPAR